MTKYIMTAGTLLVFALCLAPVPAQTPAAPRKIEILFLGHNSPHHDSAKFEPMLKAALASEPFNFTYTADPKDLNEANLAKYDELMIYANHTKIEPEQEKAFRDTWRDGIHSYLTYLRDRLTVARDLLTESGSIFVQIGDENVHRVRDLMDEVFGDQNSCGQIPLVQKER